MIAILFWLCVGSIIYAYVGYPLILAILARTRPEKEVEGVVTPLVTLLIAAHNEEAIIAQKLENSLALEYPRDCLQILVAADGSNDRTVDIVRSYAGRGVELSFSGPRRGKMAAINGAMDKVRGDIVIFSDANNLYEPNVVRELVKPFADPEVGAVSGAKIIIKGDGALGESEGLYWKYESFIKRQETRLGSCVGVAGEVLAVRHGLFEAPPNYIINDDFYLAMRVLQRNYRVVYTARARSHERVSPSAQDEMDRRARIVAGRYQALTLAHRLLPLHRPLIAWQVISHKFLRPLVPLAMVGALISNIIAAGEPVSLVTPALLSLATPALLSLATPFDWLLLLGQVLFYGLAWIGSRMARPGKLLYVLTFLVNSNLAALLGLARFLTRQQTALWQRVPRRRLAHRLPVHEEGEV